MATVTLQVTDPLSGLRDGTVSVLNPDKNSSEIFYFNQSARIAGDSFNGIYQVKVMVPQYAVPGTWSVGSRLVDNALNEHEYPYETEFPADADETFTVVNTGAVDLTDPLVTSISVTPSQINTSAGPATIQVDVSVLDDLSGLKDGYAFFYDPADVYQSSFFSFLDETNRISGDAVSGTYRFTRTLPQGSAIGQWQVRIFLRDHTGRTRFYGQGPGYEPYVQGSGYFTISSASLFAAFVAGNSLTGMNALAGADPDNDGRNNAMELMLGTNPTSAASAGAGLTVVSRTATHLNFDFTIKPSLTVTTNGGYLELRDGSGGAPLKVKGQTQAGLVGAWSSVTPVLVSGSTYRVSLPLSNGANGFLRLIFETQ